jgi:hypothetical protein
MKSQNTNTIFGQAVFLFFRFCKRGKSLIIFVFAFTTFAKAAHPPATPTRRALNEVTLQTQTDQKEKQKSIGCSAAHTFFVSTNINQMKKYSANIFSYSIK